MIESSAPGKLVLTGEYAVLRGAPALVAAVNRRVECRLKETQDGSWTFRSRGFEASSQHLLDDLANAPCPAAGDPAELAWHAIRHLGAAALPASLSLELDSRACFHDHSKLGLGSSAATVVALTAALAALVERPVDLDAMLAIHWASQGGSGSGLDVATAYHGGVVEFRRAANGAATVQPVVLPSGVHALFAYAGFSTKTSHMLQRFDAWRGSEGDPPALVELIQSADRVASSLASSAHFMAAFADYVAALLRLDESAELGIFPDAQRTALNLAEATGVLYKPCGAGGGDMGVAVATDGNALVEFGQRVAHAGFTVVPMEITRDGVRVRRD